MEQLTPMFLYVVYMYDSEENTKDLVCAFTDRKSAEDYCKKQNLEEKKQAQRVHVGEDVMQWINEDGSIDWDLIDEVNSYWYDWFESVELKKGDTK